MRKGWAESMCRYREAAARRRIGTAALTWLLLAGCAKTAPLSITLAEKRTGVVQKCSAREANGKDTAALAEAVEMCAQQLEARGYVRVSEEKK